MKKLLALVMVSAMAMSMVACGGEKDKLVMATNAEFPPYEYREGSEFVGIDVEIATAIAEEMGRELVVEDMEFNSIIPAVNSGKADMGVAGMTVSEDRLLEVDFSDTYTTAKQVIIIKEGSEIAGPDDLIDKAVGVQLGTVGAIYCEDIEGVDLQQYSKGFEAVQALSQGKVDAVVIDNEPAKVFVKENEGIVIVDKEFTYEEYAIAVKKGNTELLDAINTALKNLEESGKLAEIKEKYIPSEE